MLARVDNVRIVSWRLINMKDGRFFVIVTCEEENMAARLVQANYKIRANTKLYVSPDRSVEERLKWREAQAQRARSRTQIVPGQLFFSHSQPESYNQSNFNQPNFNQPNFNQPNYQPNYNYNNYNQSNYNRYPNQYTNQYPRSGNGRRVQGFE